MNRGRAVLIMFIFLFFMSAGINAASINEKAPDFTLLDSNGKQHKLSDYNGKYVVLEWVNFGCPFVKKHYNSKNMQNLQKNYTDREVVWLSICSSSEGKQGYMASASEINSKLEKEGYNGSAYLIDEDGKVGKMYGAKTTPHMYIIDKEGTLVYKGAIDDIKSTDVDDIKKANSYVSEALELILAQKKYESKTTAPYGCSVKYK